MTTAATPPTPSARRTPTTVDRIAEDYVDRLVELSPLTATYAGLPGREDEIDDFSPRGHERLSELRRRTLAALSAADPADDSDRVTIAAMTERLGLEEKILELGLAEMSLNVIACPLQDIREAFDLMPTATIEDWATIALRLARVPLALEQYQESLLAAREKGLVAPRRQVSACIEQCEALVADGGYFDTFRDSGLGSDAGLPLELRERLTRSAREAAQGYGAMATFLRDELLDDAPEDDACGRDIYELRSRQFLGATIDLEETYRWGQEELARIEAQMAEIAEGIKPGATVKEAVDILDADPAYQLHGTDALQEWMQGKADGVIADLADEHFDIPGPVRRIECCIAPTQTGGIYYTGPSNDFSRPGRMWWSVPKGVETFSTWRELTTVYHEGVPGHHLQVAQTVYRRDLLNRWRRLFAWTSGHGEGWALYAERLMAELGYMDDPGNRLGWLDGQSLRAARVVLDIGFHCGFDAPAEVGGGAWDYDKAWTFLKAHANMDDAFLRFELDRYLGWPGQAPAYKVGERLWLSLREEAERRAGDSFSLKDFHRRALDIGGVGLDVLRDAVLATD